MYTFLIIVIIIAILVRFRHTKIKFKTFLHKGFAPNRGKFGVYCYCGKQGSGKTYSVVEFLMNNRDMPIYANINSIKGINYTYFSGFNELLKLRNEHDCIIVFDEIFTALTKTSKINEEVLDFLSQMRKRRIVFITTAQEWLEINITLRRYCRYQIECKMMNILGLGLLIKSMYDAELLKWDKDENEYIAPLIETTISKTNLRVAQSYDTFETIKTKETSLTRYHDEDLSSSDNEYNNEQSEALENIDNDFWGSNVTRETLEISDSDLPINEG